MFKVDEHEPMEIVRLLGAVKDIDVTALNAAGHTDYLYDGAECYCHKSTLYETERKTWNDLITDFDGVEEQLGRQMDLHKGTHLRLLIEGVVEPALKGVLVYTKAQGQNAMRAGLRGNQQQAFKNLMARIHQVGKYWELVFTNSMPATAVTIGVYYDADQVSEDQHTTFNRIFKARNFRANPQAERILGASGDVRLGPVKAEAVAKHFGTAIRAFSASPQEWIQVDGIGEVLARQYLRGLGRGDV